MRRKPSVYETLFTYVLPLLKAKSSYFSLEAVKRALKEANAKLSDETLREYMSEAMASGVVHDAGRGWYTRHDKPVRWDTRPVGKLIRAVEKAFPLLDFSCWSTSQFNPFALHLVAQPTILLYAESDALESVAESLKESGWEAWVDPKQKEIARFFRPGEKSIVLRPAISKQPEGKGHAAPIEKALVDLLVEVSRLQLMDSFEVQRILDTVLQAGMIQLPVLLGYSMRRGLKIKSPEITN